MTSKTLQQEIEQAVPKLLDIARELTWNDINGNCKFIPTEIEDSQENFHVQRLVRIAENNKKVPVTLSELIPMLQNLYANLYDVNLYVYRAHKHWTVVDIQYYPKSSLDPDYRKEVLHHLPMLHCKVARPPWLTDGKEKFDVNWEHKQWLINWKLFWARRKFKHQKRLT